MQTSSKLALGLCLALCLAQVAAEEPAEDAPISIALVKTESFTRMDGYYATNADDGMSTSTLVGIILGFTVTGLFFIYTGIRIIMDENKRMKYFEKKVAAAEAKLRGHYKYEDEDMNLVYVKFAKDESGETAKENEIIVPGM